MKDEEVISAVQIAEEIMRWEDDTQSKLPYNLNVIDELHANENAHSRILCKLLQYKDAEHRYRILESLIKYIAYSLTDSSFGQIEVKNPTITQETERIDLWVRDEEYAIIFENKVNGAIDQDTQLFRYVEKTRKKHYSDEQIFIVYLPGDDHEPAEDSWNGLKDIYLSRYAKLSFRDDVINWLKNDVLPNCVIKEDLLISALKQYIDHLEGLYRQRPSQIKNNMNSELLSKIGVKESEISSQVDQLTVIIAKLDNAQRELINYRNSCIGQIMNPFKEITKEILGDNWEISDNASNNRGWLFLYNKDWKSDWCIHLEWTLNYASIFNNIQYRFVLHAEGPYKNNELTQQICTLLNLEIKSNPLYEWQFKVDKPLGSMTEDEMRIFLSNVYNEEKVQTVIHAINQVMLK